MSAPLGQEIVPPSIRACLKLPVRVQLIKAQVNPRAEMLRVQQRLSQIVGLEPRVLGYSGQHTRADLIAIMECKSEVGPTWAAEHTV
jgi:hypothetical protein